MASKNVNNKGIVNCKCPKIVKYSWQKVNEDVNNLWTNLEFFANYLSSISYFIAQKFLTHYIYQ